MTETSILEPVELLVCTTCKMGRAIEDDTQRPWQFAAQSPAGTGFSRGRDRARR